MEHIISSISNFLWGYPMIIVLLGTHIFLTIALKFPQRYIFKAIRLSFTKDKGEGDISPFASLATALASTLGTGNIIGVATAVSLGGPGAVLWCWLTGVLGIATKYAEGLLSVKYREVSAGGMMRGGPMYVLANGLNMKWMGGIFAVFMIMASFGIGNMVQANSITEIFSDTYSISPYVSGAVLMLLVMMVIIFGLNGISRTCSVIVPFMAIFYVLGCVVILFMNREVLGETLSLICTSAFSSESVGGGMLGGGLMMAMRYGVARGLFSNESGMGSAPIIAAAAKSENPVKQALISSTGTFWDTVIVCAMTGLVIVSSIVMYPDIDYTEGAMLTKEAFDKLPFGDIFISIGIVFFAFSTILGWSYYAEKGIEYLGGARYIKYFRIVWVVVVYVGSVMNLSVVWNIADITNALMVLPNVLSLILLIKVVQKLTNEHVKSL